MSPLPTLVKKVANKLPLVAKQSRGTTPFHAPWGKLGTPFKALSYANDASRLGECNLVAPKENPKQDSGPSWDDPRVLGLLEGGSTRLRFLGALSLLVPCLSGTELLQSRKEVRGPMPCCCAAVPQWSTRVVHRPHSWPCGTSFHCSVHLWCRATSRDWWSSQA